MRVPLVWLMSFAGCAEISGLGSLEVGDGASALDGANDVAIGTDAIATPDEGTDAGPVDAPALSDVITTGNCKSPADCSGNTVCCEIFNTSGSQQPPNCNVDADTVACKQPNECVTSLAATCTNQDTFRRCVVPGDCTEATYNKCCTVKFGEAGMRSVCLNVQIASLVGGTCQ